MHPPCFRPCPGPRPPWPRADLRQFPWDRACPGCHYCSPGLLTALALLIGRIHSGNHPYYPPPGCPAGRWLGPCAYPKTLLSPPHLPYTPSDSHSPSCGTHTELKPEARSVLGPTGCGSSPWGTRPTRAGEAPAPGASLQHSGEVQSLPASLP